MEDKEEEGTHGVCRLANTIEQKYDRASGSKRSCSNDSNAGIKRLDSWLEQRFDPKELSSKLTSFALFHLLVGGAKVLFAGLLLPQLAGIPNEDPTYPNIFLKMVFLGSTGHLAKPRNVHRLR
jgi:hypothetical protein